MGVKFDRGDLVFFRYQKAGKQLQAGGVVIDTEEGLLTVALPQGVEVWNMRSSEFISAWRVEHTPRAMSEDDALDFAALRLSELRRRPLVVVEADDDRLFTHELHAHPNGIEHTHTPLRPDEERNIDGATLDPRGRARNVIASLSAGKDLR